MCGHESGALQDDLRVRGASILLWGQPGPEHLEPEGFTAASTLWFLCRSWSSQDGHQNMLISPRETGKLPGLDLGNIPSLHRTAGCPGGFSGCGW
jgi:hypothetical protein